MRRTPRRPDYAESSGKGMSPQSLKQKPKQKSRPGFRAAPGSWYQEGHGVITPGSPAGGQQQQASSPPKESHKDTGSKTTTNNRTGLGTSHDTRANRCSRREATPRRDQRPRDRKLEETREQVARDRMLHHKTGFMGVRWG